MRGEEVPMISVVFGQFGIRMMCLEKFYNNPECVQQKEQLGMCNSSSKKNLEMQKP